MPETTSPSIRFSGPEEEQLVRYRAVNKLAIVAMLLGLASVLTLVHPLLMLVPLAGVVCAIVALRSIRANPDTSTGTSAAVTGLVLSLFFLGWGVGWSATRPARINQQAEQLANDWLELLQRGHFYAAHQLRMSTSVRAPLTGRLDDYYRSQPPELLRNFNDFAKSPVIEALVKAGPKHPPVFHGVAETERDGKAELIRLRYQLPASDGVPVWSLLVTVRREATDRGANWQIGDISSNQGEEWPALP
jgi:hypothetical protein